MSCVFGPSVAVIDEEFGLFLQLSPLNGDFGEDGEDVKADVDVVRDGGFVSYSATRFWLKKPRVCLVGVAVSPMMKASK